MADHMLDTQKRRNHTSKTADLGMKSICRFFALSLQIVVPEQSSLACGLQFYSLS
jgi:hypothetical protein